MRLRFLGTGTSFGVPVVGCECATCTSSDPRDRRTRHGVVIEDDDGERRLLVDTPPELRLQLLRAGVDRVDAVWFTHSHADHVHGVDDLRAFTARSDRPLDAFAGADCAAALRRRFGYVFDGSRPVDGTTKPDVRLHVVEPEQPVEVAGFEILPIIVPHGPVSVFDFRTGPLGYVTDAAEIPEPAFETLRGVRTLVLNALWFGRPHPTHLTVEQAVAVAHRVGAERTYLTHLTHRVRHTELLDALPPGIEPAFDGLVVDV